MKLTINLVIILILQALIVIFGGRIGQNIIPDTQMESDEGEKYSTLWEYIVNEHDLSDIIKYVFLVYILTPVTVGTVITLPMNLPISTTVLQKGAVLGITVMFVLFTTGLFIWFIGEISNKETIKASS